MYSVSLAEVRKGGAILAVLLFWGPGSRADQFRYECISVEHGLSQSSIWCIFQDSRGFMWFGTADGLNRYDGYSFRVFRHDPKDSASLSNNTVWSIHEDRSGMLWIGTLGGVEQLNPRTLKFTHLADDPRYAGTFLAELTYSIYEDRSGMLWFASTSGISILDQQTGELNRVPLPPASPSRPSPFFRVLHEDDGGNVWMSNGEFIFRYDRPTQSVHRVPVGTRDEPVAINRSLRDREGVYWFAAMYEGLLSYDPRSSKWSSFRQSPRTRGALPDDAVRTICEDNEGRIWIGTRNEGLFYLERSTNSFHPFDPSGSGEKNTFYEGVSSILCDRSGLVWVGYDGAGIIKLNPHPVKFHHVLLPPSDAPASGDNFFKALMVDHQNNVWLGMYDQGMSVLDRRTGRVTRHRNNQSDPTTLRSNTVFALLEDRRKSVWIGTYEGVDEFDRQTGQFKHHSFAHLTSDPRASIVNTLAEDSLGGVWCGTATMLLRFDRARGIFDHILSPDQISSDPIVPGVTSLAFANDSTIWVGTLGAGLVKLRADGTVERQYEHIADEPNSLSHNNVKTILIAPDSIMWIGTEEGLNRFDPKLDTWRVYRLLDGLPNEFIYGVLMDEQRRLWISTNKGICRMDTREPDRPSFRNYTPDDGLQSYEFNTNVYFKTRQGEMFFGGINGFNTFFPDSVKDNPHPPPVVLTGFKKFDLPVQLEEDISLADEVRLSYDESVFSIEFAALEFTNSSKNRYAYRMDGIDKDWVYTQYRREARYTNLDPDEYIFHVKGSNNDGVWNEVPKSLRLVIVPPFWRTAWFIGLMALAGIGAFGGTVRFISTQKLKRKIEELERQKAIQDERLRTRERIARDLHDDLASTVGSAGFFVESVKQQLKDIPPESKEFLDKTSSLLTEAEEAMSDIVWSVSPKHDTLESLLARMRLTAADLCRPKEIKYETVFTENAHAIILPEEVRRNVYLVFKEALTNAVRHSGASFIRIAFNVEDDRFEMSIEDNGKGMPSHEVTSTATKRGHGVRNMMKRAEEIGATMSIEQSAAQGTVIRMRGTMPAAKQE